MARWTPGGRGILVSGFDKQRHHVGFYVMDTRNGEARRHPVEQPRSGVAGRPVGARREIPLPRPGRDSPSPTRRPASCSATRPRGTKERSIASLRERTSPTWLSPPTAWSWPLRPGHGTGSTPSTGSGSCRPKAGTPVSSFGSSGARPIRRDGLAWTPDGRYLLFAKAVEVSRVPSGWSSGELAARVQEAYPIGVLVSDMAYRRRLLRAAHSSRWEERRLPGRPKKARSLGHGEHPSGDESRAGSRIPGRGDPGSLVQRLANRARAANDRLEGKSRLRGRFMLFEPQSPGAAPLGDPARPYVFRRRRGLEHRGHHRRYGAASRTPGITWSARSIPPRA